MMALPDPLGPRLIAMLMVLPGCGDGGAVSEDSGGDLPPPSYPLTLSFHYGLTWTVLNSRPCSRLSEHLDIGEESSSTYGYDGDRLVHTLSVDDSGDTIFESELRYDSAGLLQDEDVFRVTGSVDGEPTHETFTRAYFWEGGRLARLQSGDDYELEYGYDAGGELTELLKFDASGSLATVTSFTYWSPGVLRRVDADSEADGSINYRYSFDLDDGGVPYRLVYESLDSGGELTWFYVFQGDDLVTVEEAFRGGSKTDAMYENDYGYTIEDRTTYEYGTCGASW